MRVSTPGVATHLFVANWETARPALQRTGRVADRVQHGLGSRTGLVFRQGLGSEAAAAPSGRTRETLVRAENGSLSSPASFALPGD
jgi:hypothetical protein